MSFCTHCGRSLVEGIPPGDDRSRLVCPGCGHVAYQNPKVVVAALPVVEGRVLLLRRGIEPRRGCWSYPGGFLEMGETLEEAIRRETREEMGVGISGLKLLGAYSRPPIGVVVIVYLADIVEGEPRPTTEALEVAYFSPEEIPWDDLAFPTTVFALRDWAASAS